MASSSQPSDDTHESVELVDLFETYTAASGTIGEHLSETSARATDDEPLLVATGADLALYPGRAKVPSTLPFRLSSRGFKELSAVSHLGPAVATIIALKEAEPEGSWLPDAQRLLEQCQRSRKANTVALWRDVIAVEAFRDRENAIARMVDYALAVTIRYLEQALAEPSRFTHDTLRAEYLDDGDRDDLPVSFNRVMIATFFLVGMDISHRLIAWLDGQRIDWTRTMAMIVGKQGRDTAGVTWRTNSVAGMILAASRGQLSLDRLYIAPHAPVFKTPVDGDLSEIAALEPTLRSLWAGTRAVVNLGGKMFPQFPAFAPDAGGATSIDRDTQAVGEMPAVASANDWFPMITRLRMVMEDPRQLLSGAVSDFAAQQLIDNQNDPSAVTVPGLDDEAYPSLSSR